MLNGEELMDTEAQPLTLGRVLSDVLIYDTKTKIGALRALELARKVYTADTVDMEAADVDLLRRAIEHQERYNNLVMGQAMEALVGA